MTIGWTTPLVIMGMHRSGTSLLAQTLDRAGVLMGRDASAYDESNFFQRCNEALLRDAHASWDCPAVTNGNAPFAVRQWLTEFAGVPRHMLGWLPLLHGKAWGWKDPRNTFTLGSWQHVFPRVHVIHIYRNGMDVAMSLHARNATFPVGSRWHSPPLTDLLHCFELWERYVQQAQSWKVLMGARYSEVRYEDLLMLNAEAIASLETFTGRKIHAPLKQILGKPAHYEEPLSDLQALEERARASETMQRLGYV